MAMLTRLMALPFAFVALLLICLMPVRSDARDKVPPVPGINWDSIPLSSDNVTNLGNWIWDRHTFDKQTCRFWRSFVIPKGLTVERAESFVTADNGYRLLLDGREIGRGSDWRSVTEYDLTYVLTPGPHIIGVEAFNDRLEAGMVFGCQIHLSNHQVIDIRSDNTWFIASGEDPKWCFREDPLPAWTLAVVVGYVRQSPWGGNWPIALIAEPPILPENIHFWESGWFQFSVLLLLFLVILLSIWLFFRLSMQSRNQQLLQVERNRIARDIHDDLGAQLTQLVLYGEVAQREQPGESTAKAQFNEICRLGRELSQAMDEVVWAVNSRRDTLHDFVNYVCKYAKVFLNSTGIHCRLDVESEIPVSGFDLPVRRNLFLAAKEALNNAAKYSKAGEIFLRIHCRDEKLFVIVEDNGRGFAIGSAPEGRNGLINMSQRMAEIGGACQVISSPGAGCKVLLSVPFVPVVPRQSWFGRSRGKNTQIADSNPRS